MERRRYSLSDYNKKEAFEDATKFFIVYEGEVKEPEYFEAFNNQYLQNRTACILHVFENNTQVIGSQPQKLIDRAKSFLENPPKDLQVTPTEEDKFRFVLDVDDHPTEQFKDLYNYCKGLPDANLFISNFCFEVWLWFHLDEPEQISCSDSAGMKTQLGHKHTECKIKRYPKSYLEPEKVNLAISRAKRVDITSEIIPDIKSSRVYILMEELLQYAIENNSVKDAEVITPTSTTLREL